MIGIAPMCMWRDAHGRAILWVREFLGTHSGA